MMFGRKKKFFNKNGGLLLTSGENGGQTRVFKAEELKKATNNFSNENRVGQDYRGIIYKGMLPGGTTVSITQLNRLEACRKSKSIDKSEQETQVSSFIREALLLSQIHHGNIVRLLGCCLETEDPLFVYEYMVNGDLAHHLRKSPHLSLSWEVRIRVAAEIAQALTYLHNSAGLVIYHRDVTTQNILLDNSFTAKLAGFGIAQSVSPNQPHDDISHGSSGYMDPEYMDTSWYTDKSDVYSFGVVLAELLTGKRAVFWYTSLETGDEEGVILGDYFKELEMGQIMGTFLDARVKHQGKRNEVEDVIKLAKRCLEREGRKRPKMKDVAIELEKILSAQTDLYGEEIDDHDYDYEPPERSYFTRQDTPPSRHQKYGDTEADMNPSLHQQYGKEADLPVVADPEMNSQGQECKPSDQPVVADPEISSPGQECKQSDPDLKPVQDMNPPRHQQCEQETKPHVADTNMSSEGQERKPSDSAKAQKHSTLTGQTKWPLLGQRTV